MDDAINHPDQPTPKEVWDRLEVSKLDEPQEPPPKVVCCPVCGSTLVDVKAGGRWHTCVDCGGGWYADLIRPRIYLDGPEVDRVRRRAAMKRRKNIRLVTAMAKAGMSQTELAARIGVHRITVNHWVSQRFSPTPLAASKVADALNTSAARLWPELES